MSRKRSPSDDSDDTLDLDEPVYCVKRLLAEREGPDGIVRFLVLWEGYDDDQASWEPAENFNDAETTLREWRKSVAEGDVLDNDHLAELEARMELRQERDAQEQPDILEDHAAQSAPAPSNPFARANPRALDRPNKWPKVRAPVPLSRHIAQRPASKQLLSPKTKPSAAPKKQHASTKLTAPSEPIQKPSLNEPATRTRHIAAGTRFRILQNMGNARKKAAQERPVNPDDPNLKFVYSTNHATSIRSPSAESLLFFPEAATHPADSPAPTTQHETPKAMPTNRESSIASVVGSTTFDAPSLTRTLLTRPRGSLPGNDTSETDDDHSTIIQGPPDKNQDDVCDILQGTATTDVVFQGVQQNPSTKPDNGEARLPDSERIPSATSAVSSIKYGRNGLSWGKDDVVVHLSFGDHDIGPVRIVGLADRPRFGLIGWKKSTGAYDIRIRLSQENVLNPKEAEHYQKRMASFSHLGLRPAWLASFEQSAVACREFARDYLEIHDLAAVWYLPDAAYVFVVFSPRSASYATNKRFAMDPSPELMLEVYGYSGQPLATPTGHPRQSPSSRGLCWFWSQGYCKRGSSCPYAHDSSAYAKTATNAAEVPPRPPPRTHGSSDVGDQCIQTAERRSPMHGSGAAAKDAPANVLAPTKPHLEAKSQVKQEVEETVIFEDPAPNAAESESPEAVMSSPKMINGQVDAANWEFDFDYSTLLKPIRDLRSIGSKNPLIFIAFPESATRQIDAFKTWAKKHTDDRKIFVSSEWSDVQELMKTEIPKIYFFYNRHPVYTELSDFYESVYRKELLCYDVKWSANSDSTAASYQVEPLFPRGNALLLLEEVMVSSPSSAVKVLEWVFNGCGERASENVLLVRPNIVAWLNQRMDDLSSKGVGEEIEDIIKMLEFIHKFSPFDVTIPGRHDRLLNVLNTGNTGASKLHPFPELPLYDATPGASTQQEAIQQRDGFLIEYFLGFATDEVDKYRRFLIIHAGNAVRPARAQHIAFRSAVGFAKQIEPAGKK